MLPRVTSAIITLDLPGSPFSFRLASGADPNAIRRALRRAISHRRTIVTVRPPTFIANVIHQLVRLGQDNVEIIEFVREEKPLRVGFFYHLYLNSDEVPMLLLEERGGERSIQPFYQFIGATWSSTRSRRYSGKKLGRPTNISKRLAKLKAEGKLPPNFDKNPTARDMSESKIPGEINDCVFRLGPRRYGIYFPDDPPENERE